MLPVSVTVGPLATASANNIALSQTPVSGTLVTLNGSTVTGGVAILDKPRKVLLTPGSEAAPRTLVITGTNATGGQIQETLSIPATTTTAIATSQDFLTVTSALPLGGGWTAAMTLGTNGVAAGPWKIVNSLMFGPTEISFAGVVSGTANWGIEYTYDDPNNNSTTQGGASPPYPAIPTAWQHATLQNLTASQDGATDNPIRAWRPKLNSGTGSITVTAIESGMAAVA